MVSLLRRLAVALAGFGIALGAATVVLQPHGTRAQAAASDFCTTNFHPLAVKPTMPPVFPPFQNGAESFAAGQATADCTAWQQFIYMNWPALPGASQYGMPDPNAPFGTSNAPRTVWESYNRPVDIFVPSPKAPQLARKLTLSATSKLLGNTVEFSGIGQAFSRGWIAGQRPVRANNGTTYTPLVFYDVWVDRDEQDYIWRNQLQYASAQRGCAGGPAGLRLPKGANDYDCANRPATYGLGIGAVEIKAALLDLGPAPLDAQGNLDKAQAARLFPTFLVFPLPVDLQYPADDTAGGKPIGLQTNHAVGLVGLHIIRKMPGAQQFLWATFEHVDNDPTAGQPVSSPRPWLFYNAATPSKSPNANPYPCPSTGCNYGPSQIVRLTPLDAQATGSTASFHAALPANSVFRYYQLTQVQWPTLDAELPKGAGGGSGVNVSEFIPAQYAANSTLETYFQRTSTCVQCHAFANVQQPSSTVSALSAAHGGPGGHVITVRIRPAAPRAAASKVGEGPTPTPVPQPTGTPYASDLSFMLGLDALPGSPRPSPSPRAR